MSGMAELIERLEKCTGPDRGLDALIEVEARRQAAYRAGLNDEQRAYWAPIGDRGEVHEVKRDGTPEPKGARYHPPTYTFSLDAAVALVERVLPGWWWKVGTCCLSDDACLAPDFNSPVHGERLKAQLFPLTSGSEFDAGFDVDRRPPGNVPIALLLALFLALRSLSEDKT